MKIKTILITSDDGYNSIGVRLLTHLLKDRFAVFIAGTIDQQSGVGGKISIEKGGKWAIEKVNGVEALKISGTPIDAIEAADAYFDQKFDLVISGINWGANIGASLITSGTFAAAFRALGINLSKRAIALSLESPPSQWFAQYDPQKPIPNEIIEYPGMIVKKLIDCAIEKEFWGASLLNINLPKVKSNKVKFVQVLDNLTKYYKYPMELDSNTHCFKYADGLSNNLETNKSFDSVALSDGFITITPCKSNMTDDIAYNRFKDKSFILEE